MDEEELLVAKNSPLYLYLREVFDSDFETFEEVECVSDAPEEASLAYGIFVKLNHTFTQIFNLIFRAFLPWKFKKEKFSDIDLHCRLRRIKLCLDSNMLYEGDIATVQAVQRTVEEELLRLNQARLSSLMPVLFGMLVSLLSTSLLSFCLHHGTLLFTFSVAYFAAANAYAGLLCILHRNRFDQLLAKLLHLISDMKCFISSTKHILAFIHEREGLMKEYLMLTRQPADSLPARYEDIFLCTSLRQCVADGLQRFVNMELEVLWKTRSSYTSDEKEIDLLEFMFLDTDAVTHYLDELTKDSTSFVSLKNLFKVASLLGSEILKILSLSPWWFFRLILTNSLEMSVLCQSLSAAWLQKSNLNKLFVQNLSDSKTSRLSHHFGLPNSATYLKTVLGKILCHVEVAQQSLVDLANSINTDSNLIDVERFGLCYELCGSQLRFAENYLEEISSVVKQQKKEDLEENAAADKSDVQAISADIVDSVILTDGCSADSMADDEIFELYTRSQDCSVVSRSERCCLQNDDGVPSAAAGSGSFVQVRLMEELKLALRAKSDEMHSREEKALLRLKLRSGDKRIKEDEGLVQHQSPKGESIRSPLAESTTKESDGVTDAYPETGLPRSIVYRKEMEVDGNDGEDRSHASSFRGLLVAELNARFERDENYGDSVGDVGVCDTSPVT